MTTATRKTKGTGLLEESSGSSGLGPGFLILGTGVGIWAGEVFAAGLSCALFSAEQRPWPTRCP